ncbi:WD40-repeat-containing domain protein [Schizophyllum commune]
MSADPRPGYDTVWPADSVEFCPGENSSNVFVCGTYNLEKQTEEETALKKPQVRRGKCLLFEVGSADAFQLQLVQEIDLPAVLDIKWCNSSPSCTLAVADSEGHVTIHRYDATDGRLHQEQSIPCASRDTLCLSLDWSNRRFPGSLGSLVVSLSNGSLVLLRPTNSELSISETWHGHDYEPWIAAWDYWNPDTIFSGGDDLTLKVWDCRQGFAQPTLINRRFDSGITTIQTNPHIEHIVAVGSYDNSVRIFDARNMRSALSQSDVGGGAWRTKWHPSPSRSMDLAVACMHDGLKVRGSFNVVFQVLRYETGFAESQVIKRFDEHQSLAYGVDWAHSTAVDETIVASCSFYDHTLHLWRA